MASGKSSSGKSTTGATGKAAAARKATSAANRSGGKAADTAKVNSSRPAGRGPAQRPPARRKNKSIVNQKQTPWGLIATIVAIAVFAAAVIIVVVVQRSGSSNTADGGSGSQIIPSTPTGTTTTTQMTTKQIANTTGISGVLAWDTEGWPGDGTSHTGALEHNHVDGLVNYTITPPVGGPHDATWMNAGAYTKPVPTERAVHNLEHGAVWITYKPNLPASEVATLTAFVGKQSVISESDQATGLSGQANRYMDLSPWSSNSLPSPIVMSSWGYQLRVTSPTDPRLQKFVDMFRNSSKYTPEFGSAVDGIPIQTGGRASAFGSKVANPAGS